MSEITIKVFLWLLAFIIVWVAYHLFPEHSVDHVVKIAGVTGLTFLFLYGWKMSDDYNKKHKDNDKDK